VSLIARRTAKVGELIYYPFLVLFLMIVSRISYFDDWDWPPALVLVLGANAAYAITCALSLRGAAERARRKALDRLQDYQHDYAAAAGQATKADASRRTADEVREMREGAFALLSRHPILGAVLLPSGGIGIWALVEFLAKGA
jgi:hypothetical protein